MKKLITAILILAMLLSTAALAEQPNVTGVWISTELLKDGAPSMAYVYLADDQTSYYVIQAFHKDEPGLGRQYVGTWEWTGEDTIFVKTGNNTSTNLRILGDYSLDESTLTIYLHAPVLTVQDLLGGAQ